MTLCPWRSVSDMPVDSVSVATGGTSDTAHVPVFFATKCFAGFRSLSDREGLDVSTRCLRSSVSSKVFSRRLFVPRANYFHKGLSD